MQYSVSKLNNSSKGIKKTNLTVFLEQAIFREIIQNQTGIFSLPWKIHTIKSQHNPRLIFSHQSRHLVQTRLWVHAGQLGFFYTQ